MRTARDGEEKIISLGPTAKDNSLQESDSPSVPDNLERTLRASREMELKSPHISRVNGGHLASLSGLGTVFDTSPTPSHLSLSTAALCRLSSWMGVFPQVHFLFLLDASPMPRLPALEFHLFLMQDRRENLGNTDSKGSPAPRILHEASVKLKMETHKTA